MDVLPKALPEEFFLEASDECLQQMGLLLNAGTCGYIQSYLQSPTANPAVCQRISNTLGKALYKSNLSNYLRETGALEYVQKLFDRMDYISLSFDAMTIEADLAILQTILDNYDYMDTQALTRSKDDFKEFVALAPEAYKRSIVVNAPYFQDARAVPRSTGLSIYVMRRGQIELLYTGLKCRLALVSRMSDRPTALTATLRRFLADE